MDRDRIVPKVLYMPLVAVETSAVHWLVLVADPGGLPVLPVAMAEKKVLVGEEARGVLFVVELSTGWWLLLIPKIQ